MCSIYRWVALLAPFSGNAAATICLIVVGTSSLELCFPYACSEQAAVVP
jgi:hypothetical protein